MDITFGLVVVGIILIAGFAFLYVRLKKLSEPKDDPSVAILQNELNIRLKEVAERLKEQRESNERSVGDFHRGIADFKINFSKIEDDFKKLDSSVKEVSSFQQIFRTPKLRGRWGEMALEHILSQYFPKDMFERQHSFKSGEAVDAVLKLPNGRLLPIDSKFPYENFERMNERENDKEREVHRKNFAVDIKQEIDNIAKKYILPSEGTMDVACMYVPAEAVYFEINNSMPEIVNYSHSKRVFLTSPNTFHLMMSAIEQWARDLQIGRQTKDIMKRMEKIISDAQKLDESFGKLGKHLSDARSSYEDSEKRLGLLVERTEKLIELENQETTQIESPSES